MFSRQIAFYGGVVMVMAVVMVCGGDGLRWLY